MGHRGKQSLKCTVKFKRCSFGANKDEIKVSKPKKATEEAETIICSSGRKAVGLPGTIVPTHSVATVGGAGSRLPFQVRPQCLALASLRGPPTLVGWLGDSL